MASWDAAPAEAALRPAAANISSGAESFDDWETAETRRRVGGGGGAGVGSGDGVAADDDFAHDDWDEEGSDEEEAAEAEAEADGERHRRRMAPPSGPPPSGAVGSRANAASGAGPRASDAPSGGVVPDDNWLEEDFDD